MFAAYFDESGTHSGSDVLSVAGYVASDTQWGHFAREWTSLLDEAGFEPQEPFHMTDFEHRSGRYASWSSEYRSQFISRAIGILKRRIQYGFSASVDVKSYNELIIEPLRAAGKTSAHGAHTAYGFCFAECLKQVAHWAESGEHRDPIAYFLESGAGFGNDVHNLMRSIEKDLELRNRFRLATWSFGSKAKIVQFQAADINAFESYRYWCNQLHARKRRSVRLSFSSLMDIPQDGQYIGREDLSRLIERLLKEDVGSL